eukprot:12896_1
MELLFMLKALSITSSLTINTGPVTGPFWALDYKVCELKDIASITMGPSATGDTLVCAGTHSCSYLTLIQTEKDVDTNDRPYLLEFSGDSACRSSAITTVRSNSLRKFRAYCGGSSSCQSAQFDHKHVACWGQQSCAFSAITYHDSTFIEASGAYSLYKSIISTTDTPGNNMSLELRGYQAGFGAKLTCQTGDFCDVQCYGNACLMLLLDCHNNCQVHLDDCAVAPIYDISDYDETQFNLLYRQPPSDTSCDVVGKLTFDIYNASTTNINVVNSYGVCCRGRDACSDSVLAISSAVPTVLLCGGAGACDYSEISDATTADIYCTGSGSCNLFTGTISTTGDVYCLGQGSCHGHPSYDTPTANSPDIINARSVYCAAVGSCGTLTLFGITNFYQLAMRSADIWSSYHIEIQSDGDVNVYLKAQTGGNVVVVCNTGDSCYIECEYASCKKLQLYCHGACTVQNDCECCDPPEVLLGTPTYIRRDGSAQCMLGTTAYVTGDPHIRLWNGNSFDFMGASDRQLAYYMHPCKGATRQQMPFTMIGRHVALSSSSLTGLDYIVLELFDIIDIKTNNIKLYLLWVNPTNGFGVQLAGPFSDADIESAERFYADNTDTKEVLSATNTRIGNTFDVDVTFPGPKQVNVVLNVAHYTGDRCKLVFYMNRQGNYISTRFGEVFDRYTMNSLFVEPPWCFRCHTCGLFGSFEFSNGVAPHTLTTCNGASAFYVPGSIRQLGGWTLRINSAYDVNALTWDIAYTDCPVVSNARRRRLEAGEVYNAAIVDGFVFANPCVNASANHLGAESACNAMTRKYDSICSVISTVCDELLRDCILDVCVVLYDIDNPTNQTMREWAQNIFGNVLEFLDTLPSYTVANWFDEERIFEVTHYFTTTEESISTTDVIMDGTQINITGSTDGSKDLKFSVNILIGFIFMCIACN